MVPCLLGWRNAAPVRCGCRFGVLFSTGVELLYQDGKLSHRRAEECQKRQKQQHEDHFHASRFKRWQVKHASQEREYADRGKDGLDG